MRAALIQLAPRFAAPAENLRHALERMSAAEAELYVLPELYASGYTFTSRAEVEAVAEPAAGGASASAMMEFARRRRAWAVYGFAERGAGGAFHNSASLVGPEGVIGTYRKIHLFGREKLFFQPGAAAAPVYELEWGRLGLMICFDWYFPELCRSLALRGADVIAHPSNLVLPHCPDAMITRSLENRVFSLTCDRVGVERNGEIEHTFIGSSQAVSPRGEVLARLSRDREEVAVVTFDPLAARDKRVGQANDVFADRSPTLYEV